MASLPPLGKPMSPPSVAGSAAPLQVGTTAPGQPVSVFQWLSIVRATWTWLLRPLWILFFQWPAKIFFTPFSSSDADRKREEDDWDHRQRQDRRNENW